MTQCTRNPRGASLVPALAVAALCLATLSPRSAAAQHEGHGPSGRSRSRAPLLGRVTFPNLGNASAQEPFRRGPALLHSFEYNDGAEAFREAQRADDRFALPYWMEALTHSRILWGREDVAAAPAALARLGARGEVRAAAPADFAVVDARVFDGERVLPRATVVVREGRIASVTTRRPARLPATVIDGRGRTLLPGLIDAHFHTGARELALTEALHWGVTTMLDMFGAPELPGRLRALRARPDLADTRASGAGATQPGGHGTQWETPQPTLSTPEEADAFVAARVAEGADFLKIIVGPGRPRPVPALDSATVAALVRAAHRRNLLAVVHPDRARDAELALRAGADGLVHVWRDTGAAPAVSALAAARGAFAVPTLVLFMQWRTAGDEGRALAADARVHVRLSEQFRRGIMDAPWVRNQPDSLTGAWRADSCRYRRQLYDAVADLRRAGVRILAGSDAPNVGMSPLFLHRELELLVEAGLTPAEALAAATSQPADAFRLADRGRIRAGLRADLLLVEGDPVADITATRGIVGVWKEGVRVP